MRIAAFSDWRVQPFEPLIAWLEKVKPDLILYCGDDTIRLGGFTKEALHRIVDAYEHEEELRSRSSSEDFFIQSNSTMSEFKKYVEHESRLFPPIFRTLTREIIRENSLSQDGTWIGPPPRTRGTCLYYKRKRNDWLEILAGLSVHGFAGVVGNDCEWADRYRISGEKLYNVHEEPLIIRDIAVLGLEGSPLDIGAILYEEDEAQEHLESQYHLTKKAKIRILVTHAPPKGVLDLSRRFDIRHIGSQAVSDFIEERDVDLVICGHSHINGGRYERVGNCYVVNIASHDYLNAPGKVALIELDENGECDVSIDILYEHESALLSLHKVGPTRALALEELGIDSLKKIMEENRSKMRHLHGVGDHLISKWIIEARLMRGNQAARVSDAIWNEIDLKRCLVYDIETDIFQKRVWSIGVYTSDNGEYTQFFEKDDEKKLLEQFFEFVQSHCHLKPYTFSSTDFDLRILRTIATTHNLAVPVILEKGIDIGWLTVHRTLGTPKGGLKTIGPFFGYEWRDSDIGGIQTGMLYSKYLSKGEEPDWDKLLQYNCDDVMATFWVLQKLLELEEVEL